MTYVEFVEDASGDAVDVLTYCAADAPNLNNAWPCWPAEAYCYTCGDGLRDGPERGE